MVTAANLKDIVQQLQFVRVESIINAMASYLFMLLSHTHMGKLLSRVSVPQTTMLAPTSLSLKFFEYNFACCFFPLYKKSPLIVLCIIVST